MADETKEYVLVADGCQHDGERYRRGDTIRLTDKAGERLLKAGAVRQPDGDDPEGTPAELAGLGPVAGEASTLGSAQTVTPDDEIKASSFGHPDQVEAAEKEQAEREKRADATKPGARRAGTGTPSKPGAGDGAK